jgi:hypothetical protein
MGEANRRGSYEQRKATPRGRSVAVPHVARYLCGQGVTLPGPCVSADGRTRYIYAGGVLRRA